MTLPVGPSRNRRMRLPTSTATQARPRPAAATTTAPRRPANPFLADPSQANRLRTQIGEQARNNPSAYGSLVSGVNGILQRGGFGISPSSHRNVMENLRQVSQGQMRQSTAHFREVMGFSADSQVSRMHGRVIQAEVERAGAVANLVGGIGMLAVEGAQSLWRMATR